MERRAESYRDFWPVYLAEHSRPGTRALHNFGTGLGIVLLCAGIWSHDWRLVVGGPAAGYAFAWIGHAFIERNRPATFSHPLWSLISDLRMFALWLGGRMGKELARHGVG